LADLLEVSHLSVEFPGRGWRAQPVRAVNDVSFTIQPGETVGLVGESGSGKTTIGRAILGLIRPTSGRIVFGGINTTGLRGGARRALAKDLQVVFQDPYSSLNPSLTIGSILVEPLQVQRALTKAGALAEIRRLLDRVGLPADAAARYPAHFSGGQRQRVAIARALSVGPKLVVCDEPTSALDVSTQAQVLALLRELQRDSGMSYLFITHDLAVVRHFADRVLVLRRGELVEAGPVEQVCEHPQHPYTRALVQAAPVPDPIVQRERRLARERSLA